MHKSAHISKCKLYRYSLTRQWDSSKRMMTWLMLNPSTAGISLDDATIRKCVGFAKRWGMGGIYVVNLFAFRATDPRDLKEADDPVGPDNMYFLMGPLYWPIVVGWGAACPNTDEARAVIRTVTSRAKQENGKWFCLGQNKNGSPKHPLMLPYTTKKERWPDVAE